MARNARRQERSFGDFGWPAGDEPSTSLGPDWSNPATHRAIAQPFGSPISPVTHAVTGADRGATVRSEAARWPAGPDERDSIGYASPDALQAAASGVDERPLVAAAAETATLEMLAAQPAMTREQADTAATARHDQVTAALREAAMLEQMLALPDATDPYNHR